MSSSGGSGGVSQAAFNGLAGGLLQNGIINSGDLAQSTISITTATGALAFTVASATAVWILSTAGALQAVPITGAAHSITPGSLPASTKYAVIGLELTNLGGFVAVKGTDTATQLNTGTLIASNTPAVTSGNLRVLDIAVYNNAGSYEFGDQTTTATKGVNWIDRRPWARGALIVGGPSTTTYTNSTTGSYTSVDTGYFKQRVECGGGPVNVIHNGNLYVPTPSAGAEVLLSCSVDGVPASANQVAVLTLQAGGADSFWTPNPCYEFTFTGLAAGSHLFEMVWEVVSGTWKMGAGTPYAVSMLINEQLRASASNGAA